MTSKQFTKKHDGGEPSSMPVLQVHRSGDGDAIVMLHGWSMNSTIWQPLLPQLEKRYRIIRVDLPGHGVNAAWAGQPDLNDWLRAILAVVPERAIWLGWSLGASLAMAIAAGHPQRVARLCLIAGTPKFVASDDWPQAVSVSVWQRFVAAFEQDPEVANQLFMQLQSLGVIGPRQLGKTLQQMQIDGGKPSAQGLLLGLRWLRQLDLRNALTRLTCPLHLLLGEHDKLVPAGVAAEIGRLNTHSAIAVINGAGHVPVVSHAAETLAWLESVL